MTTETALKDYLATLCIVPEINFSIQVREQVFSR